MSFFVFCYNRIGSFLKTRRLLLPVLLLFIGADLVCRAASVWRYSGLVCISILYWIYSRRLSFRQKFVLLTIPLIIIARLFLARNIQLQSLRHLCEANRVPKVKISILIDELRQSKHNKQFVIWGKAVMGPYKGLRVYVTGSNLPGPFFCGDQVLLEGDIQRLWPGDLPGVFNEEAYLAKRGFFIKIKASALTRQPLVRGNAVYVVKKKLIDWRNIITNRLCGCIGSEEGGLVAAMLYGDESAFSPQYKELFRKVGLSHVLVASGTNVSLCLEFLSPLLALWRGKRRGKCITQLLLLGMLAMLSLGDPAITRAVIMKSMELICLFKGRLCNKEGLLYTSIFIMALINPYYLCSTGFIMSALATQAVLLPIPFAFLAVNDHDGFYQRKLKYFGQKIFIYVRIRLLLEPIVFCFQKRFFWSEIPANLFLLPLTELVLLMAFVFILFSVYTPLAAVVGMALRYLLFFLKALMHMLLAWSGQGILLKREIFLFYTLIPWQFWGVVSQNVKELVKTSSVKAERSKRAPLTHSLRLHFSLFMAGLVFMGIYYYQRQGVYFLSIGQGDASLIITSQETIMIDCGPPKVAPDLLRFFEHQEINRINYFYITHLDSDHCGTLRALLEAGVKVDHLYVSPYIKLDSQAFKKFEKDLQTATSPLTLEYIQRGHTQAFKGVFLEQWGPIIGTGDRNEDSLCMRTIHQGQFSIVWTGDQGQEAEARLLKNYALPKSTILHLGHHGSKFSSCHEFLKAISPSTVLISCGYKNNYGHPHREVLERIPHGCKILRTDREGSFKIIKKCNNYRILKLSRSAFLPEDYARITGTEG